MALPNDPKKYILCKKQFCNVFILPLRFHWQNIFLQQISRSFRFPSLTQNNFLIYFFLLFPLWSSSHPRPIFILIRKICSSFSSSVALLIKGPHVFFIINFREIKTEIPKFHLPSTVGFQLYLKIREPFKNYLADFFRLWGTPPPLPP